MMYMYWKVSCFIYPLKRWRNNRYSCISNNCVKFVKIIGSHIFHPKNKSFLNLPDFDCMQVFHTLYVQRNLSSMARWTKFSCRAIHTDSADQMTWHVWNYIFQVVKLREVFPHGTSLVLAFEYMLSDLSEVIRNTEKPLTEGQVKSYMLMLLKGVAFCHENNIMHRVCNCLLLYQ